MNVLVTGGAGYVGSHATRALLDRGDRVVVLDQLSHGHRKAVDQRALFIHGSTGDPIRVLQILRTEKIEAVLHFATDLSLIPDRSDPEHIYANNVSNTLRLLETMAVADTKKLVFSSTTAVYGDARSAIRDESRLCLPRYPYGRSMMMAEMIIEDFARAHELSYAILRYDNAIGAHPSADIGEDDAEDRHLLSQLFHHLVTRGASAKPIEVDGSRMWDCLHVMDVVRGHLLALDHLRLGKSGIYNLTSGEVYSANALIEAVERVVEKKIPISKRLGRSEEAPDEPLSSQKIRSIGWRPEYPDLETMIAHAWNWYRLHPAGYNDRLQLQPDHLGSWDKVDQASWESFPASDAPGYTRTHASGARLSDLKKAG